MDINVTAFLYLPSNVSSGMTRVTMTKISEGRKEKIKSVEIITTILATL